MKREPLTYLWDVQYACRNVFDFVGHDLPTLLATASALLK